MPGPVSDSFRGPKGHMPLVPSWMDEPDDATCTACNLLLDDDYCHQCERVTRKDHP